MSILTLQNILFDSFYSDNIVHIFVIFLMITLSCTSDLASGIKGTMKTEKSHFFLLYLFIHFINIYSELTGLSTVLNIRK